MPAAIPFTTLGARNGFGACLTKIDVSTMLHWTTFSGYNYEAPDPVTPEQVDESFRLAMQLYWNCYAMNFVATNVTPSLTAAQNHLNVDGGIVDGESCTTCLNGGDGSSPRPDPSDRVCGISTAFSTADGIQVWILRGSVVRMYNGDTTDEANFVGWGAGSSVAMFRVNAVSGSVSVARVQLYGATPFTSSSSGTVGYASIDGFHFVCYASATATGSGSTETEDPENATAVSTGGGTFSGYSASAIIVSLSFYTYP